MSSYDTQSLYDFLFNTPEGALRKMLNDKKNMTDVHCNLLIKIVKSVPMEQFGELFDKKEFPKIRLGPAEMKIKEKFWENCTATLLERGILQPADQTKPADPVKIAA